jgi:hypothetical protein
VVLVSVSVVDHDVVLVVTVTTATIAAENRRRVADIVDGGCGDEQPAASRPRWASSTHDEGREVPGSAVVTHLFLSTVWRMRWAAGESG